MLSTGSFGDIALRVGSAIVEEHPTQTRSNCGTNAATPVVA
jgi:hypothetical protein